MLLEFLHKNDHDEKLGSSEFTMKKDRHLEVNLSEKIGYERVVALALSH